MGILAIFFVSFYGIQSLLNTQAWAFGSYSWSPSQNNPGFLSIDSIFNKVGCIGTSSLKYDSAPFENKTTLYCSQFKDLSTCNSFSNCNYTVYSILWINLTSFCGCNEKNNFYSVPFCDVNLSYYGFPSSPEVDPVSYPLDYFYFTPYDPQMCNSQKYPVLNNRYTCEKFGCIWNNGSVQFSKTRNILGNYEVAGFWDAVGWAATFKIDLGWGVFNVFITLYFWFLMIALGFSIYYTFVPF
jgi:hypothetical protein